VELAYQVREQFRAGAFAILVVGIILTLVSIFADPLALGIPHSGFGWKQMLGTLIGLTLSGLGLWLTYRLGDGE
jgi:uncharacterized RDD family membrane protein YckC